MKKLKHLQIAVALLLISFPALAQVNVSKANLTNKGIIELPAEEPLSNSYEIDISDFNFESETEAVKYFGNHADDFYFIRPVLDRSIAIVYLQLKEKPEWSTEQWNNHLESKMSNQPIKPKTTSYEK